MSIFVTVMRQMFQRQPLRADHAPFESQKSMSPSAEAADAPDSMPMIYRSEAFAEDLYDMQLA